MHPQPSHDTSHDAPPAEPRPTRRRRARLRGEAERRVGETLILVAVVMAGTLLIQPMTPPYFWLERGLYVIALTYACFGLYLAVEGRRRMREAERERLAGATL